MNAAMKNQTKRTKSVLLAGCKEYGVERHGVKTREGCRSEMSKYIVTGYYDRVSRPGGRDPYGRTTWDEDRTVCIKMVKYYLFSWSNCCISKTCSIPKNNHFFLHTMFYMVVVVASFPSLDKK